MNYLNDLDKLKKSIKKQGRQKINLKQEYRMEEASQIKSWKLWKNVSGRKKANEFEKFPSWSIKKKNNSNNLN